MFPDDPEVACELFRPGDARDRSIESIELRIPRATGESSERGELDRQAVDFAKVDRVHRMLERERASLTFFGDEANGRQSDAKSAALIQLEWRFDHRDLGSGQLDQAKRRDALHSPILVDITNGFDARVRPEAVENRHEWLRFVVGRDAKREEASLLSVPRADHDLVLSVAVEVMAQGV